MPSSAFTYIPEVLKHIYLEVDPKTILDVGVGFGKWGFLCREYLDVEKRRNIQKKDWKVKIDGIEGYKEYIGPVHHYIYNVIILDRAERVMRCLASGEKSERIPDGYDLILAMDIIEHMEKKDAILFLKDCFSVAKNVIISTPLGFRKQDEISGNSLEIHRSGWKISELVKLGFRCKIFSVMSVGRREIVGFWKKEEKK